METRKLIIGDKTITYNLTRKKVKNINLREKQSGEVVVSAPFRADIARIDDFVMRNAEFIFRALDKYSTLEKTKPAELLYVTGESLRIMGEDVTLKLYEAEYDKVTFV